MKKFLVASLFLLFSTVISHSSVNNPEVKQPVIQSKTLNSISLYAVGSGTVTAVYFNVYATSFSFRTVGGLAPNTTFYKLNDSRLSTVYKLNSFLNSLASITTGQTVVIVSSINPNAFQDNVSTTIAAVSQTFILTSTNPVTLTTNYTKGISITIPNLSQYRIHIADMCLNATFSSGTTYLDIYDGATSTNTLIRHEKLSTSATDGYLNVSQEGYFNGSFKKPMRIDLHNDSGITDGYINTDYYIAE